MDLMDDNAEGKLVETRWCQGARGIDAKRSGQHSQLFRVKSIEKAGPLPLDLGQYTRAVKGSNKL